MNRLIKGVRGQLNLNTFIIGGLCFFLKGAASKLEKAYDAVNTFQERISGIAARIDRQENRLDRLVEELDGGSPSRIARSPKDASNHPN